MTDQHAWFFLLSAILLGLSTPRALFYFALIHPCASLLKINVPSAGPPGLIRTFLEPSHAILVLKW